MNYQLMMLTSIRGCSAAQDKPGAGAGPGRWPRSWSSLCWAALTPWSAGSGGSPKHPRASLSIPEHPGAAPSGPERPQTSANIPEQPRASPTIPERPGAAPSIPEHPQTSATISEHPQLSL